MENRPPVETGVWRRKRVETRSMMVRDLTRFSWFCVVAMRFNARLYGCRLKPASETRNAFKRVRDSGVLLRGFCRLPVPALPPNAWWAEGRAAAATAPSRHSPPPA
jgi:hypothetical protein